MIRLRSSGLAVGFVLVLLCNPACAQQKPLPPEVQAEVDAAINKGVKFLLGTQTRSGSWSRGTPADKHFTVGYAAMPALTLLECGVPSDHRQIQMARNYIRYFYSRGKLNRTYEVALSILFLDKLGNPKDRVLIERLAGRLMAGQTPTGGWSYKCPILKEKYHKQLITVLKRLDEPVLVIPRGKKGPEDYELPKIYRKIGEYEIPVTVKNNENPEISVPVKGEEDPSIGDLPENIPGTNPDDPKENPKDMEEPKEPLDYFGFSGVNLHGRCIRMFDPVDPLKPTPDGKPDVAKKWKPKVRIPMALRNLPVLNRPGRFFPVDPQKKNQAPMFGTTDNSNSQFAILALWAASRHKIPAKRTLNLIAYRYVTSQSQDGGWEYRYKFGGQGKGSRPAMTCVGLIGLAVGHGLAMEGEVDVPKLQFNDPRIVRGFVKLQKHLNPGAMNNLYFLWSVERVAVLYNLDEIGGKDWYRLGVDVLLPRQKLQGYWTDGGYHNQTEIINTCLALLFLKRANLAKDLGEKLPFNPKNLNKEIAFEVVPPEKRNAEKAEKKAEQDPFKEEKVAVTNPDDLNKKEEEDKTKESQKEEPSSKSKITFNYGDSNDEEETESSGGGGIWVLILGIVALLAILGGIGLYISMKGKAAEDRPRRRRKKKMIH